MPQKMMTKYSRIRPHTSAGTRRKPRRKSRHAKASTFSKSADAAINTKEAHTLSRRTASSLCPNRMENSAPLPMQRPSRIEVRKVINVNDEPTAARAFFPRNCPTINVSATL